MARTSWWVRSAEASTRKVVGSGTASTNEPRPWKVSTRPSARSRVTASRTTVRETAYAAMSSDSEGSFDPGRELAGEDALLEPGDDALGESGGHRRIIADRRPPSRRSGPASARSA